MKLLALLTVAALSLSPWTPERIATAKDFGDMAARDEVPNLDIGTVPAIGESFT